MASGCLATRGAPCGQHCRGERPRIASLHQGASDQRQLVTHRGDATRIIRSGDATEIWATPPPGVDVRNPYFESTPLDLVTAVISDVGILGTGMIPDVCEH